MRARRPDTLRPYCAWGYPIVPALCIIAATALMADLLIMKPAYTWPGLLIALSGAPVYWLLQRSTPTSWTSVTPKSVPSTSVSLLIQQLRKR
jgi:APA family basic amino acid/polyamine antiporter